MWNTISSKAINLLRSILHKDPERRPSAKDIASHLWLNHIDPIPRDLFELEEVNLSKVAHKIKRHIVKDRLKVDIHLFREI